MNSCVARNVLLLNALMLDWSWLVAGRNISVKCKCITVLQESYLDTLTDWAYCVIGVYSEIKKVTLWGWNQTRPQGEVQYVFHLLFSLKAGTDPPPETWRL